MFLNLKAHIKAFYLTKDSKGAMCMCAIQKYSIFFIELLEAKYLV